MRNTEKIINFVSAVTAKYCLTELTLTFNRIYTNPYMTGKYLACSLTTCIVSLTASAYEKACRRVAGQAKRRHLIAALHAEGKERSYARR